ncbi:hypothetical protein [Glycomyces sp. MUSA5-2]|uniref:hypothetical protein n=1 Tax=Glycomyces sp. MUSA5-2 TaxID=2053002 RepID=UPI00300BBC55
MTAPDPARHFLVRPGAPFTEALDLPGWEDYSIWGYDDPLGSFFAQLWRNDSGGPDEPQVAINGFDRRLPWPQTLAVHIRYHTKTDPAAVVAALGIADPDPHLRPPSALRTGLSEHPDNRPFAEGWRYALHWLLGTVDEAPGSRVKAHPFTGDPHRAAAESAFASGRCYMTVEREWYAGADTALAWALRRAED